MQDCLIINSIPLYMEAPISANLLRTGFARLPEAIADKKKEKNYLMVDQQEVALIEQMKAEAAARPAFNLHILPVDPSYGFTYSNATAAAKVIEGEKPIPSGVEEIVQLYTVEELLAPACEKMVMARIGDKNVHITIDKTTTPKAILAKCQFDEPYKAIYFGYPMGLLIGESDLRLEIDVTTDCIEIIPEQACILDWFVPVVRSYLQSCCGRCVFGYEGVTQIYSILSDISQRKGKTGDLDLLMELCQTVQTQSLCNIGNVAAKLTISAISEFRLEIEAHITKKGCKAGVCRKFITYHILQDLCTGCNVCQDECEDDAILGKKKFIHVIDQDECTQCGNCLAVCPIDAIVTAGVVKPKCPKKPVPCKK